MAYISHDSVAAKRQRKVKKIMERYDLDRLDVTHDPLHDNISIFAIKGDTYRNATINQNLFDWPNIENVVAALFDNKTSKE